MITLDIIIVNWNSGRQLQDCLTSVAAAARDGFEFGRVVVVDNASCDGSAEQLHATGLPLHLIRNVENCGFAAACNQGAANSSAEYLLFLNPDTRLFEDTLSKTVAFVGAPENEHVGIVGVQLVDAAGQVAVTCSHRPRFSHFLCNMLGLTRLSPRHFPDLYYREWDHAETREVDQVMGAFFFIRRALFEVLHGFDERFFVYFEEVDLTCRASQQGWVTMYLADAKAFHRGNGTTEQIKATRLSYYLRSRILYVYKHWRFVPATCLALATLLIEPFTRIAAALAQASWEAVRNTMQGYLALYCSLPELGSKLHRFSNSGDPTREWKQANRLPGSNQARP